MICYYRNNISWGANRMEFKDPIEIKAKLKTKMGEDQVGLSFWESKKKNVKEKRGEERRREEVEEEEEEKERYGFL